MAEIEKTENQAAAPLLKRAFIFLEDGNWQRADEYCEKVLDLDPECARAYLGKLLAEMNVRNEEQLPFAGRDFSGSDNYAKAVRFGCTRLVELNKQAFYNACVNNMNNSKTAEQFLQVRDMFMKLDGFMDSSEKAKECEEKVRDIEEKAELARIHGIYEKAEQCVKINTIDSLEEAAKIYESIPGYMDADRRREECYSRISRKRKKGRHIKKITACIFTGIIMCASFVFVFMNSVLPVIRYNNALNIYYEGNAAGAASAFRKIKDYKNSDEMIEKMLDQAKYDKAVKLYNEEKYSEASDILLPLKDKNFRDSYKIYSECCELILFEELNKAIEDNDVCKAIENTEIKNGTVSIGGSNWLILEKTDDSALIMTKLVVSSDYAYENWETSELRKKSMKNFIMICLQR